MIWFVGSLLLAEGTAHLGYTNEMRASKAWGRRILAYTAALLLFGIATIFAGNQPILGIARATYLQFSALAVGIAEFSVLGMQGRFTFFRAPYIPVLRWIFEAIALYNLFLAYKALIG